MNANTGILQHCTFVLFMPASLPNLVGNIPAFPMRSALLAEVSLYLLRAWPHFIELFHEVCPGNALPWAVVTVLGDEKCWCLQEAEEVEVLGDLHLEFLFLSAPFWGLEVGVEPL